MEELVTAPTLFDKRWLTEAVRLREEQAGPWRIRKPTAAPANKVATWRRASKRARCGWPNAMV